MNNNAIFSIYVYKHNEMWVFDDDRVGLVKEPFVAGADTLLDKLAQDKQAITLIFSKGYFPSSKVVIEQTITQGDTGTNYIVTTHGDLLNHELWLCPALNLYYSVSPQTIYVDYKLPQS